MKHMLFVALGAAALAITVQPTSAADLPVKAPALQTPPLPAFNWTGLYVGGHIGYGWGEKSWRQFATIPIPIDFDVDGFLGGGQIGFNVQSGPWVWGVEADISWTNADGNFPFVLGTTFNSEVKWLATVTGRIGYAWGPSLLYVKGGGAWADEDHFIAAPVAPFRSLASETRSGWIVGVGYEHDFGNNWSAKLEYNYINFGRELVTIPPGPPGLNPFYIDQDLHAVKLGINYRFAMGKLPFGKAPSPVVSKY